MARKKKFEDNVSGKQHPPTRGVVGDTRIKGRSPGPQAAYQRAAGKASTKSFNARLVTGSNSVKAHTQAVAAHHQAAAAAEKAGMPEQATYHRQQANQHSFAARNHTMGMLNAKASGAFGTDPTTGNAQSKAKIMGVHTAIPKGAVKVGEGTGGPSTYIKVNKAGTGYKTLNPSTADRAGEAERKASIATAKTNQPGGDTHSNHIAAAQAHDQAAHLNRESGNRGGAQIHEDMSANHRLLAREGGRAKLGGIEHGGGPNNATRVPVHPAMRGEASTKYNSASVRVAATAESAAHGGAQRAGGIRPGETGDQYRARKLGGGGSGSFTSTHTGSTRNPEPRGTAPGHTVTGDASAHANAQSIKANAKPSLASHSMAAKAHLHAASVNRELAGAAKRANFHEASSALETAAAHHEARAMDHKALASQHSQRIMKLKKLGPGQHHGAGGRFEGTPGGAK